MSMGSSSTFLAGSPPRILLRLQPGPPLRSRLRLPPIVIETDDAFEGVSPGLGPERPVVLQAVPPGEHGGFGFLETLETGERRGELDVREIDHLMLRPGGLAHEVDG